MRSLRPWREQEPIQKFRDELNNMMERFFDEPFFEKSNLWKNDAFTPACNIEEKKDKYVIKAEIAGVDPKDVEIEINGNMLSIKGERKQEATKEDENNKYHMVEHRYGSFYRSFTLPDNVNTDDIKAKHDNGILKIEI